MDKKSLMSYIFIVINIFKIFVVIGIFNSISGTFETTLISLAILIYLHITDFTSAWTVDQFKSDLTFEQGIRKIKSLILKESEENIEDYSYEELEKKEQIEKQAINLLIMYILNFIITVITLWNLLSVLYF